MRDRRLPGGGIVVAGRNRAQAGSGVDVADRNRALTGGGVVSTNGHGAGTDCKIGIADRDGTIAVAIFKLPIETAPVPLRTADVPPANEPGPAAAKTIA